jgi:signal transduction histidine kinase
VKKILADDKRALEFHDEWYWPVGAGVVATLIGVGVVAQRDALASPDSATLWAGLAVAPFVFDAVLYPTKRMSVPIWLFVPMVIGAVVALEVNPVANDAGPFFLVLLCAEMGSRLVPAGAIVVLGAALATMLGIELWAQYDDSLVWFIGIALGWAGGFSVQSQFRLMVQMKTSQETRAARAVAEERARIAREIHDVVAHTLSVTMLHLTGARLALERGDRDEATAALLEAEKAGRESLADIRATVNVLADGETGTDAPMPTAGDLADLVGGFRAAGLDVDLDVQGDADAVPAATGLAVYRIAQESLANVAKHAPGAAATVRLDVRGEGVLLEVRDSGNGTVATSGEGRGLEGMKERAELLGGTVQAGRGERGWVVTATLPGPDRHKWWCG